MNPYIGITGFMTPQEVRATHKHFLALFPDDEYDLMAGVLVSPTSRRGEKNKHPHRYPVVDTIPHILQKLPRVLNVVHYCEKEDDNEPGEALAYRLSTLARECGPNLHGVQLNMTWPRVESIRDFHLKTSRQYNIILQVNRHAMAACNDNADAIAERVASYGDCIDAVLIDESGGNNRSLDVHWSLAVLNAIERSIPLMRLVVGGLSEKTARVLWRLLAKHPRLSCDAESGVRDPVTDDMDILKAIAYVSALREANLCSTSYCACPLS